MRGGGALTLLRYSFTVWVLCAATVGVGMRVTSLENALLVHLIGAPVFATAVAFVYFRRQDAWSPFAASVLVLSVIVFMDLVLVACVINRNIAMFRSVLGTWLPLALIFGATYGTGAAVSRAKTRA